MSGKAADLCVTVLRGGGQGYAALGLGWEDPEGGWRLRCWAKPGAGRIGLFLPEGRSGVLPTRVTVHTSAGERLGSGAYVPGLRGVMIRADAWPTLEGGGCWL
ncbi:hypothetical protein ACFFLM_03275 [Deinococcus oregonensis]|uniref:Uncharacterized protein n=1 Tax=Deinococcus oregonensis TaxID=1805970 RepID=A0ABV6AU28_9DEIO